MRPKLGRDGAAAPAGVKTTVAGSGNWPGQHLGWKREPEAVLLPRY
jgi:hypothetical protein